MVAALSLTAAVGGLFVMAGSAQAQTVDTGSFISTQVACTPGAPIPWTATAVPNGITAFVKGQAEVTTAANGFDADYSTNVVQNNTTVVQLSKLRP